jgi:hypothetical protein
MDKIDFFILNKIHINPELFTSIIDILSIIYTILY